MSNIQAEFKTNTWQALTAKIGLYLFVNGKIFYKEVQNNKCSQTVPLKQNITDTRDERSSIYMISDQF